MSAAVDPEPLEQLVLTDAAEMALFLDFDGTLADIVERPDEVELEPGTREVLARLHERLGGALAIVTGRPIDEIDRHVGFPLAVAGVHGLIRRDIGGRIFEVPFDREALEILRKRLDQSVSRLPGTLLEQKPGSVAFHFRTRPDLQPIVPDIVAEALQGLEGMHVVQGKMVVEIKAAQVTKADAVAAFMAEEPFAGRSPIYAGDDVTDEDGFRAAAGLGGVSIKVGGGPTGAHFRVDRPASFRSWLSRLEHQIS